MRVQIVVGWAWGVRVILNKCAPYIVTPEVLHRFDDTTKVSHRCVGVSSSMELQTYR